MIFQLLIIVLLTGINAFFAATEMAVVSINKNSVKMKADDGNKKARMLYDLIEDPSRFLATIQVAITFAGFFSSAFAATGISLWLTNLLEIAHVPYSNEISIVTITILLSFFMLLFGELIPKRLALQNKEKMAMFAIGPLVVVAKLFLPFVVLLSVCTKAVIRLAGFENKDQNEQVSEADIRSMVKAGHSFGTIKQTEKNMINRVFEFDDRIAREIMRPRLDVVMLDINSSKETLVKDIVTHKYSRFPVYDQDKDSIIGLVLAKEILRYMVDQPDREVDLQQFIKSPFLVPETKTVEKLFRDMKAEHIYFAMLIDEYGVFSGIVTMEDIIEEVMGDIFDEYDEIEQNIVEINGNEYQVKGKIGLVEFNYYFGTAYEDDDYDTLSGFLIHLLGRIPQKAPEAPIKTEKFLFYIHSLKDNRIDQVIVKRQKEES